MMKRTTIFADDYLMKELKEISKEENRSVAGVIREAVEKYVRQKDDHKRSYLL
jgi:predicted transcriptional regulator